MIPRRLFSTDPHGNIIAKRNTLLVARNETRDTFSRETSGTKPLTRDRSITRVVVVVIPRHLGSLATT